MAALGRSALRATRTLRASGINSGSESHASAAVRSADNKRLQKTARRDPELYTLGAIMTGAFAMAGYYFASKPTSSSSEATVAMKMDSEPWQSGTSGKYQYHPGGDVSKPVKDAPSALHSVILPNVNLPAHLHDHFNKYDKEEFDDY